MFSAVFASLALSFRSRAPLQLELLALRHRWARIVQKVRRVALWHLRGSVIEVQHSAHARPPANDALAIDSAQRLKELVQHALMIPLRMIVRHEFGDGAPKVGLAKQHDALEALLFD